VPQIFNWQDGHTIRAGVEYRVAASNGGYVPLRAGYLWDGRVSDPAYPSAFGTPPTSTNSITVGLGYVQDDWQVNAAGAYRFGGVTVTEDELGSGCDALCAKDGDYRLRAVGLYVDGSVRFDVAGL
jgi:long-subunit fatty acid transport protein